MDRKEAIRRKIESAWNLAQWIIAVYAIIGNTYAVLDKGYEFDIPVLKYIFVLWRYFEGWGVEEALLAIALGVVFHLVRKEESLKNPWINGMCAFFAICTVVGISYSRYDSWEYLFAWWMQTVVALFVAMGYFFLYRRFAALIIMLVQNHRSLLRTEMHGKAETVMFGQHAFRNVFLLSLLVQGIYLLIFFPWTLHWDALEQLWRY